MRKRMAKLEQNYGSYKLTIKERGGKTEEITAAEIGYKVVITNELQAAIDQQAAGVAGAGALTIAMPLSCDQTMLANRIASLNCMSDSVAPTGRCPYIRLGRRKRFHDCSGSKGRICG